MEAVLLDDAILRSLSGEQARRARGRSLRRDLWRAGTRACREVQSS